MKLFGLVLSDDCGNVSRCRDMCRITDKYPEDGRVDADIFEPGMCLPCDNGTLTAKPDVTNEIIRGCFK